MSSRGRYLQLAVVLGAAVIMLPAVASSETTPVEAVNEPAVGPYPETHRWSPAQETVTTGAVVTFRNPTTVYHGVHWISGPTPPECSNTVPVGTEPSASNTNWTGTCTFKEAGTYTFYCTVHGASMSGKITVKSVGTPTATTEPATELTKATARLNGVVNPEGNATEYRFDYGTGTVSEHTTSALGLGATDFSGHHVSAALTGLTPGTEYRAELVAIYGAGATVLGGEQTFTTPVPMAPTVATGQASGLTETTATLKGTVDPNEGEATEYSFEYGTTPSYGQSTKSTSLPQTDRVNRAVSATLTGLAPGTEYHFRLIAHNDLGPATGVDHTFTTAATPPPTGEPPPSSPPSSGTSPPAGTPPLGTPPLGTPDLSAFVPIPPAGPIPSGSPLVGGAHALALAASQRGPSVHGSIDVSAAGTGGRLEVALFAAGASLAAVHHPAGVRVGRLVRSSVHAGIVSFTTPLSARARTALHRHHRLSLTVQIVLTPLAGAPARVTRSVVVRG
jgi:plastocyanin